MLSLAVVLQLVPFLYMFGALLKLAFDPEDGERAATAEACSDCGGHERIDDDDSWRSCVAFFPAQQITSVASYEAWMFGGTAFFIGLAAFFFYVYGRRKAAHAAATGI